MSQNRLKLGDRVIVIEGPLKGRKGTISRINMEVQHPPSLTICLDGGHGGRMEFITTQLLERLRKLHPYRPNGKIERSTKRKEPGLPADVYLPSVDTINKDDIMDCVRQMSKGKG